MLLQSSNAIQKMFSTEPILLLIVINAYTLPDYFDYYYHRLSDWLIFLCMSKVD